MEYDDTLQISTPEGVELSLLLAGVGSRFASALIDFAIQVLLVTAVSLFAAVVGATFGDGLGTAVIALASFGVFVGYDVFFEVLQQGRTPGKRLNGLRVVREDGGPIRFVASVIRNVMRVVDFLPAGYLVGIVSVIATDRNQRIGDLLAGTIVVRERVATLDSARPEATAFKPPQLASTLDLGGVSAEDVLAVRRFLDRRAQIPAASRAQIAETLATRLLGKVPGVPEGTTAEEFLHAVAARGASRAE